MNKTVFLYGQVCLFSMLKCTHHGLDPLAPQLVPLSRSVGLSDVVSLGLEAGQTCEAEEDDPKKTPGPITRALGMLSLNVVASSAVVPEGVQVCLLVLWMLHLSVVVASAAAAAACQRGPSALFAGNGDTGPR